MNKYKIEKKNDVYCVIETENDFLIKQFESYKNARNLRDHLNSGGGFDGFTPLFFTYKYKINYSLED
jgi:hypothetical protein